MSNKVKDMNIKSRTYDSFNDIINIENFNPNNIEIGEKSYKDVLIYYSEYVTIKEYLKIYSVNPLYLVFRNVNGYFEESNKSKYLTLVPTNKSKEKLIRDLIRLIIKNSDDYDEKYMKIKLNSDDELPLNKTLKIPTITIVVRAIFLENK